MSANKFTVDKCPDAGGGFVTIRMADGSPNGNIESQPIATVYKLDYAKLLAAAPDLLAALEMFLAEYSGGPERESRPEIKAARAAIAKAKGESV